MKLSDKTLAILKNFATINPSIILRKGNVLRTMSPQRTVITVAKLEEEFPKDAAIYDVPRFLSALSLYKEPDIKFGDKGFEIVDGKRKINYVYTDPSMVVAPPEKEIKLPTVDLAVDITWSDLQTVIKAAGIFQLPELAFIGDGKSVYLRAINSATPSSDDVGVEVGETTDTFRLIIKVENLKLMAGDYHVELSSKGISSFEAGEVKYMIAVDSKSTYRKGE